MGQIEDLRLFVQIIEEGSISAAAIKSNIAKSAVSRRLALLEDRYESVLIKRGPGKWAVTEIGEELHRRAIRTIAELDELDADFVFPSATVSGPLSVSVPRDFGLYYLNDALSDFKVKYPQIILSVDFDDRAVDLEQENYDFVIRITRDWSSASATSHIGTMEHGLFASPAYLHDNSKPQSLADLKHHQLVNFGRDRRASWEFLSEKDREFSFEFQPFLNTNSGVFLLNSTIRGLGISRLPFFLAEQALTQKSLVRVLPEQKMPEWKILLLHSRTKAMNRRMKVFFEEIRKACLELA